jgi:hypothetical protein
MTAFKFVGDPRHQGEGPDAVTVFAKTFGRTHGTEVTDAIAIRKLQGHTHFEAVAPPERPRKGKRKGAFA